MPKRAAMAGGTLPPAPSAPRAATGNAAKRSTSPAARGAEREDNDFTAVLIYEVLRGFFLVPLSADLARGQVSKLALARLQPLDIAAIEAVLQHQVERAAREWLVATRRPEAVVHDLLLIPRASSSTFNNRTEPSAA